MSQLSRTSPRSRPRLLPLSSLSSLYSRETATSDHWLLASERERETDRQTDRQRRATEREKESDGERERERDRERQRETERDRERQRELLGYVCLSMSDPHAAP